VISLKKHIDEAPDLLRSVTSAYQSSLAAIARAASSTNPQLTPSLQRSLDALNGKLSPKTVAEIDRTTVQELEAWGERTSNYFRQKTAEVKEILLIVTQTAQSVGDKDARFVSQFSAFSVRLNDMASLEDLTQVRQLLFESADDLKNCAGRMAEDGKALMSKLQSEVATYQARLEEAEKQASLDLLTGLDNRRGIERRLEDRVAGSRPFSLIFFDLNGFKQINDTHGHLTGDELLKQFSAELRSRFRPADLPGRWGGDEFLIVFDGGVDQAHAAVGKASEWLFGSYRLKAGKVQLTASVGIAEWDGREIASETLKRADTNMYKQKQRRVAV
jgi:diguanylate cyclase (GGDEF)-like protein